MFQYFSYDIFCCIKGNKKEQHADEASDGMLYKFFKNFYAPFLMTKKVRAFVMVVFFGWLCSSIAVRVIIICLIMCLYVYIIFFVYLFLGCSTY